MKFDPGSGELGLADNHPLSLRGARGLRIVCTAGTIWLTVDGEPGDIFLLPGQSHRLVSNGLALVESIGGGRIRLERAAPLARLRQRTVQLLGVGYPARSLKAS